MENSSELVMASLEVELPEFLKSKKSLLKLFPNTEFIFEKSNFCCESCSRGILRVSEKDFYEMKKRREEIKDIELEVFSEEKKVFQYRLHDSTMAKLNSRLPFFVVFPITIKSSNFVKIKIMILEKYIDDFFKIVDEQKINFKNFSKKKIEAPTCKILTDTQRMIFALAYEEGYYSYPRRISLKNLSDKVGTSTSNLSKHLMKIESKIMNIFAKDNSIQNMVR